MSLAFGNPMFGNLTLIREAMRSPNYVAGVSGWSINRDGSAEFASGTFRGVVDIGNGTYRVVIGDEFGRVQFLNGAGTIEHGAVYDDSTANDYAIFIVARNANTVPADPPGASIALVGDNDTVSAGPTIQLGTFNPQGRPGEAIIMTTVVVSMNARAEISGRLDVAGALDVNGNTDLAGSLVVGTTIGAGGVVSGTRVVGEYSNSSGSWVDANVVASSPAGSVANLSLRTLPFAAQARLGTGANDIYWRDAGDSAYIGHQASAYTVASRESSKAELAELGDTLDRLAQLHPVTYRRRHPGPEVPAADLLHLVHPDLRSLGPTAAVRAVETIHESSVTHAGFTVEDVAAAFPEVVVLGDDGAPAAYDLAGLLAATIRSVQQLAERVAVLEAASTTG